MKNRAKACKNVPKDDRKDGFFATDLFKPCQVRRLVSSRELSVGARHKSEEQSIGRSAGVPPAVSRASCPWALGVHVLLASSFPIKRLGFILAREREAPATAGGTPALRPMDTAFTFMSRTRYQLSVISTFSSHRPAYLQLEN